MYILTYMTLYIHAADVGFCDCPDILPPDVPTEPTPVVPQPPPGNNFYTSNLVKNLENLTPCSLRLLPIFLHMLKGWEEPEDEFILLHVYTMKQINIACSV